MQKYFTSFVAASTVTSLSLACRRNNKAKTIVEDKQETKKTETKKASSKTLKKGANKKGQFKIGVVGSDHVATPKLQKLIKLYTQDIEDTSKVGKNYFTLPTELELKFSKKFNAGYEETKLQEQVRALKVGLKTIIPLTASSPNKQIGDVISIRKGRWRYIISTYEPYRSLLFNSKTGRQFRSKATWLPSIARPTKPPYGAKFEKNFLVIYKPYTIVNEFATPHWEVYDAIFTYANIEKIYQNLESTNPTGMHLYDAFRKAGIDPDARHPFWSGKHQTTGRPWYVPWNADWDWSTPIVRGLGTGGKTTGRIYFNKAKLGSKINELGANALQITKTLSELTTAFKDDAKKALSDKTQLASKKLDALFVQVSDGVENDEKVYKAVVEKKEFKNTHLFFIGNKAKSQSGSSSKTFAGGKVSTASYDKYAATYIAGFQAAAGTLKYSESEDSFVETSVVFLVGANGESDSKKKAFAFRRGVEAAKNHPAYSKYLKVKFVSKTEDSSKASKKLFREVSEWKEKSDSKTKLYQFSSSDTFSDAERRVIYLAGTTARDWIGQTKVKDTNPDSANGNPDHENKFWKGDDTGLIGALYNYKKPSAKEKSTGESANSLTDKTYSRNVWVVLDKAYHFDKTSDWNKKQQEKGGQKSDVDANSQMLLSNKDNLSQVFEAQTNEQVKLRFERHEVKFYGAIGQEPEGTKVYAKNALRALFMGGVNYMVGKHTIFGAQLDVSLTKNAGTAAGSDAWAKFEKHTPWSTPKDDVALKDKNKARYEDSLNHAWEKELSKDALVKQSAWLK